MLKKNIYEVISVGAVISLVILLVNDFYLKRAIPSIVTGKLSDFAGLFLFPLFISTFFPTKKLFIYGLTLIGFFIWKLPIADNFIIYWNNLFNYKINRVSDYTDYIAFLILPISYYYGHKKIIKINNQFVRKGLRYCFSFLVIFSFLATAGTHGSIKEYSYNISKENLELIIYEVIEESREIILIPDTNFYFDSHTSEFMKEYMTIEILEDTVSRLYKFRFYGNRDYWNNHPFNSEIFISHVKDSRDVKFSIDSDFNWLYDKHRNGFIDVFERCFIKKLNKKIAAKVK